MNGLKRFNEWPAAIRAAAQLAATEGRRFRVYRSPWVVYGWRWWIVEPAPLPAVTVPAAPRVDVDPPLPWRLPAVRARQA